MARNTNAKLAAALVGGLLVTACGGGGDRPGLAPAPQPAPPLPPPPPPPPPAAPSIPAGPIGLVSDQPFATQSAWTDGAGALASSDSALQISYSASDNVYTLVLPDESPGQLRPLSGNGSFDEQGWLNLSSTNSELVQEGLVSPRFGVTLYWPASSDYSYTSMGFWYEGCPMGPCQQGAFAYGIPTAAGDVPVTGSASYNGRINGITDTSLEVWGSILLNFDFAAGTLSGEMRPEYSPNYWDAVSLGTYTFRDTIFSVGSTTFSGAFIVPGSDGPSSFFGSFTGPEAAELMARWQAPYVDSTFGSGTMTGVWIARR